MARGSHNVVTISWEASAARLTSVRAPRAGDRQSRAGDGVLGLYATLWTGRALAARADGTLAPRDAALLERLGL